MLVFTGYYKFEQLSDTLSRYDATEKTGKGYPFFEEALINKSKFNIGGLSFNYIKFNYQ